MCVDELLAELFLPQLQLEPLLRLFTDQPRRQVEFVVDDRQFSLQRQDRVVDASLQPGSGGSGSCLCPCPLRQQFVQAKLRFEERDGVQLPLGDQLPRSGDVGFDASQFRLNRAGQPHLHRHPPLQFVDEPVELCVALSKLLVELLLSFDDPALRHQFTGLPQQLFAETFRRLEPFT